MAPKTTARMNPETQEAFRKLGENVEAFIVKWAPRGKLEEFSADLSGLTGSAASAIEAALKQGGLL